VRSRAGGEHVEPRDAAIDVERRIRDPGDHRRAARQIGALARSHQPLEVVSQTPHLRPQRS
jgi:hypothetical protein